MDHVIVRIAPGEQDRAIEYAKSTPDGELLDLDVFEHQSTILLEALRTNPELRGWKTDRLAYLPVQQPLMLENLLFRPGLDDRARSLATTRLTEYAIGEAFRRDVGEVYFLCRHEDTCAFAERHHFVDIGAEYGLKTYRFNLRERLGVPDAARR
jgi:hypothetical protein